MTAYEKLGVFYLGKAFDMGSRKLREDLVLYDSKDLTTHAVIIGMTGSGKTGLALALLEEALIDNIPVIAIDPKGDLPNLLLSFPNLSAEEFLPWVDEQEAAAAGLSRQQFAGKQAELWRKGLADWDQGPERIARLRSAADFAVYTPGSRAGLPVNALGSFAPPAGAIAEDRDLLRDRIQATATSLLALAGIEADPITSREHILLANLFSALWSQNKGFDLAGLVRAIQAPPFTAVGVMDLESFFPAKERFQLAMRFNNLLAAPGFEAWLEGAPLDIGRLLFTAEGRPRASIFTISHLGDAERMFFVSKLLNEVLAWVRTQSGTSSLRAVLYMDEIFGYFPPVSNPPSKQPLLTLLKQARAFGLGVVLSTQNPVDLDYKGLANTGTWFIGRLQTEGDKQRVMAGLEGAAADKAFDRARMEKMLAGLGKRVFLLNNVHENEPVVFQTRWTLSYLRGPMTRENIKALTAAGAAAKPEAPAAATASREPSPVAPSSSIMRESQPPVLPPGVSAYYLPAEDPGSGLEYFPTVLASLDIHYTSAKQQIDLSRRLAYAAPLAEGPVPLNWDQAVPVAAEPSQLSAQPAAGARFAELPAEAKKPKAYEAWRKDVARWVRQNCPLRLLRSTRFGLSSRPEESKAEFMGRLAQAAREQRDLEAEKLRSRYGDKFAALKDRLQRAEQAVEREHEQLSAKKVETAISFGTAILGAFLGRKAVSSTTAGRLGTAMKSAGRLRKESQDTARAQENAEAIKAQMAELDQALQADIAKLETAFDPSAETLQEISVAPTPAGIAQEFFGLVWLPYRRDAQGKALPAWKAVSS
ncbi:MAG: ATP-binding protein [Hyphomicrobiales bacterium]